jgi:hypothetical protein
MDANALPVASPDAPGTLVHSLTLELTASEFALTSRYAATAGAVQDAPALRGPYEARNDTLYFHPIGASGAVTFTFRQDSVELHLRDAKNHLWLMRRQK